MYCKGRHIYLLCLPLLQLCYSTCWWLKDVMGI